MAKTSGGGGRKAASAGAAGATPAQAAPAKPARTQAAAVTAKATQIGEKPVEGVTAHAENWPKKTKLGVGYVRASGLGGGTGKKFRLFDDNGRVVAYSDSQKSLKEWGTKNLGTSIWASPGSVPPEPKPAKF